MKSITLSYLKTGLEAVQNVAGNVDGPSPMTPQRALDHDTDIRTGASGAAVFRL